MSALVLLAVLAAVAWLAHRGERAIAVVLLLALLLMAGAVV